MKLNVYISLLVIIIVVSCQKPEDVYITDKNVYEHIDEITIELDSVQKANFKFYTRAILLLSQGCDNKRAIYQLTNKRYEDLTLGDIKKLIIDKKTVKEKFEF